MDYYYQYDKLFVQRLINYFKFFIHVPFIISYKKAIRKAVRPVDYNDNVLPTMMPNWDHTPRSLDGGSVLHNATPELFYEHAVDILSTTKEKKNKLPIFV